MKTKIIYTAIALVVGLAIGVGGTVGYYALSSQKEVEKTKSFVGNPVSGMSKEEAFDIAVQLAEGKDMGSWNTMTAEEFLQWWLSSNSETSVED